MSARNRRQGTGRIPTGHKPKVHKPKQGRRPSSRPAVNPLDDPNAVTAPQTYRSINRNANTAANLRYGGQERALAQQQQNVPAWFGAYRAQVQGINQGIQTGYQQAITDVNTRAQQAQTTDNAGRAQLLNAAQQDATSRGATVDPSLFAADAGAGATRRQGQNDFAGLLASQGQANNAYLGNLQAASGAGELGQQARIGREQQGVAADKGAYRSQYVSDARDTAVKDQLTRAAFDIPTANAQLSAQTSRQNSRRTARSQRAQRIATAKTKGQTVNKWGYTNQEWSTFTPGKRQGIMKKLGPQGAGDTAKQKRLTKKRDTSSAALGRLDDINARWHSYRTQTVTQTVNGKDVTRPPTPDDVTNRILGESGKDGHKFTASELHLARLIREGKRFTQADVDMAHRLGISVPSRLRPGRSGGSGTNQKYATNRP